MKKSGDSSIESTAQSASAGSTPSAIFARSGEYWTVGYSGTTFSLKDIKGLSYIQRLLQHPGEKFHALDLLSEPGVAGNLERTAGDLGSLIKDGSVSVGGLGDAGEMLDAQAKQNYKLRLIELREELAELEERGDLQRAEKTQSEIDFLAREIGRAVGLGGRSRHSGSAAERARLNVTRAIKAALLKVSERSADLGAMLDRSIRTGFFCSYLPDASNSESWQFSLVGPEDVPNGELKPVGVQNGELKNHDNGQQSSNGKSVDFPLPLPVSEENQPRRGRYGLARLLSAAGLALVAAAMIAVPHLSRRAHQPSASKTLAGPAPQLPNKPSIAVLPFINLSGDREQEYFSDGVTGDLITGLSRLPALFVIARASTFTYKGKAAKLQDLGRDLGVKYVLEGSVRKAAERLRITVQLADASTGAEMWAEDYDRPLRDVFALQDEIVRRVVTTLNLQIGLSQQGVVIPRSTENLEAYDDLLRGTGYLLSLTKDGNAKARQMLEKAIELDPRYSLAYALLGLNYYLGSALSFNQHPDDLDQSLYLARHAAALDDSLAVAHGVLGQTYLAKEQYEQALTEAQRCITLDPNTALCYSALGAVLAIQGSPSEAIAAIETAKRLDPRNGVNYLWVEGWAYTFLGRWDKAIAALNVYLGAVPDSPWPHAWLASDYYSLGDMDAARAEAATAERLVALAPSADGYAAVAYAFNFQGKPAEGRAAAERGIRLYPNKRGILFQLVFAYTALGRWEESVRALKRYLTLYPGDISAHAFLARNYSALGDLDAARTEAAEVERGLILDANFASEPPRSYDALAEVMNDTGRPAEALAAAEKSNRPDRVKLAYLYEQGRAYTQLGRWQEAISSLKAYLAAHPREVWPHVDLAVDYVKLGQDTAARGEVAEILRLNPQFSLKLAVSGEFPAQRERATDLNKAGLK